VHVGCIGASPKGNAHLPDLIVEACMPDLENLKKQAKLILRWHRDRYYPVAPQIRELMPRFLNMSDSEILAASFKLSDAQEMVARQHGFDSWQALKAGLSATPRKRKSSPCKPTIVSAEPQLFVVDIKRSCQFFCKKLGFSLIFAYGNPPYYAQVGRDGARLNLRCVERPVIESLVRDRNELLSASMTVATAEEIKLLSLEFRSAGVTFHQTLKKQPWGARNFVVKDPDGNLLLFAGPGN
jgi:catechol 2,3-dioxygenase-like lactoylglutathione lyase family enzyme